MPAGTAQTYQVTVRNIDNPECGTDTFSLIPDSFHLFSVVSNGPLPIAPQGSATFTVTATSDPSVPPGTVDLGFTIVGSHHGSLTNRGSVGALRRRAERAAVLDLVPHRSSRSPGPNQRG